MKYKSFSIYAILCLALSLPLVQCTKDRGKLLPPAAQNICGDTTSITYTNTVNTILLNNCTFSGCHDAGSVNGDYTIYSGIKAKVDAGSFQNRVFSLKDMPSPSSPGPTTLSECDLARLRNWVSAGAPQ